MNSLWCCKHDPLKLKCVNFYLCSGVLKANFLFVWHQVRNLARERWPGNLGLEFLSCPHLFWEVWKTGEVSASWSKANNNHKPPRTKLTEKNKNFKVRQFSVISVSDYTGKVELNFIEKSIVIWHSAWSLAEDADNSLGWNLQANLPLLPSHSQTRPPERPSAHHTPRQHWSAAPSLCLWDKQ